MEKRPGLSGGERPSVVNFAKNEVPVLFEFANFLLLALFAAAAFDAVTALYAAPGRGRYFFTMPS